MWIGGNFFLEKIRYRLLGVLFCGYVMVVFMIYFRFWYFCKLEEFGKMYYKVNVLDNIKLYYVMIKCFSIVCGIWLVKWFICL